MKRGANFFLNFVFVIIPIDRYSEASRLLIYQKIRFNQRNQIAESLIEQLIKYVDESMNFANSDEWPLIKLSEIDGRGRSSIQKICLKTVNYIGIRVGCASQWPRARGHCFFYTPTRKRVAPPA